MVLLNLFLLKLINSSPYLQTFLPHSILSKLPPLAREIPKITPFLIGGTLILILGLIDDIRTLSAKVKLICQIFISTIMFFSGVRITLFTNNPIASGLLTVFWMVAIINSFNLLDNMDGLACGVALIVSFLFFGIAVTQNQIFTSCLLIIFAGALAGFLRFNFYPSKIFMGDAGSMWIGFMLATLTIITTYYSEGKPTLFPVFMPLLILGVPIFDTLSVIIIRLIKKRPLFVGDQNHFSHRLVQLGMSQPQAVIFIYLVTFCVGINATLLSTVGAFGVTVILLQAIVIFVIILILEIVGRKTIIMHQNQKKAGKE